MHKNFGEWYRLVALEPDGARLAKRWAGVKAWATALRKSDEELIETVRIFQGLPSKTSRDAFLTAFQEQDPAFPQRNDLELQILAGASLVACVQSVGEGGEGLRTAVLASAAVEASSLRAGEPRLDEVSREILARVHAIAIEQRRRKSFDRSAIIGKADAAAEAMKQVAAAADWNQLKNAVTPVLQALLDAVRGAERELGDAAHNLRCADEETNILWWVEGGFSRDINKPWSSLKEAAAIIAGAELADLTDVALGLSNAAALLERVVSESKGKGKEVALAAYVNALPDEWARGRAAKADDRALDLTPLTLAVVHRGKSNSASWQQYFDASSGMKSSIQLTAARVVRQAYVEAILLRALADIDTKE
jgi:GTPase-associated system helical domain